MSATTAVSRDEFVATFEACKNWGRWGSDDRRGALNFAGATEARAAAHLVRSGRTISCARPLETDPGPDNPLPVLHHMTTLQDVVTEGTGEIRFTGDYVGMEIHGDALTHIDALCHVAFRGQLFNGVPVAEAVGSAGARLHHIGATRNGIVTRGVLVDVPRTLGLRWLEPGHAVTPEEFLAAESSSGTRLHRGDVLFLRTGHTRRRREEGPWDAADLHAGLHVRVMPLLHERELAALACDSDGDARPSRCEGVPWPIHAIGIAGMGLHFVDHLDLEELAAACAQERRWEFMCVIAPLALEHATGSPVNPLAIL